MRKTPYQGLSLSTIIANSVRDSRLRMGTMLVVVVIVAAVVDVLFIAFFLTWLGEGILNFLPFPEF